MQSVTACQCARQQQEHVLQVLTDAADSPHGTLAMLCLAALARGVTGHQRILHTAARAVTIPQAKLTQMFKQLAPNLRVN